MKDDDFFSNKDKLFLGIKIEPEKEIQLEHSKSNDGNWHFLYNSEKMLSSKELDMISDKTISSRLPDMFYGYNRFFIANPKNDFLFEINPLKMVDLTNYKERNSRFFDLKKQNNPEKNSLYYIPEDIKVQFYNKWKNIKVDKIDVQKKDPISDWSFSTPYIGDLFQLSSHKIFEQNFSQITNRFDNFSIESRNENNKNKKFKIEKTNEEIPIQMLGRDNPIIHYMEVILFEDELNDNGLVQGNFRFRVMKDCFFGLLRNYLRVDNVICRSIDTRIFHKFDENFIMREHLVKEGSYEKIRSKGFEFTSDFSLSYNQSDVIAQYLDEIFAVKEKIFFDS